MDLTISKEMLGTGLYYGDSAHCNFCTMDLTISKEMDTGLYCGDTPHCNFWTMDLTISKEMLGTGLYCGDTPHCNFYTMDLTISKAMLGTDLYCGDTPHCNFYTMDLNWFMLFPITYALFNASVVYSGPANLPKYVVKNFEVIRSEESGYAVLQVTFELERRYSLLVLMIFFPTILLDVITIITSFVSSAAFEVRTTMSLTTLLVMYTLYDQVDNSLPETAYIKMVDVWFFFCIFFIFAMVVIHIAVNRMPREDEVVIVAPSKQLATTDDSW
ncbi:hypothetical protein SK128_001825 [Halocaridina rubra]|uniref:Neurotransmitter-gated ion-channel transmembrane domain-containing protein n=1 Tax=Halocaridina rubra TaxID=373956 RepID=A0AAN9A799_HALRR